MDHETRQRTMREDIIRGRYNVISVTWKQEGNYKEESSRRESGWEREGKWFQSAMVI